MNIAEQTVDEVKQIRDLITIISDYIQVKKRGSNYIGLCPFHNEKTPSFTINQEKNFFYCFGCHEKGDHISFVQKIESISFIEAIEQLAKRFGIAIIKQKTKSPYPTHQKQYDILEYTKNIIVKNKNNAINTYLKNRTLNETSIDTFEIGLSPPNLYQQLRETFSESEISESKLFIKTEKEPLNRFKDRLLFPIYNDKKKVIGFGGRTLSENKAIAKYINSEESKVFNKKHLLYGIHLAKEHIKKEKTCIIVEGYLDVILMHQHGFKNTVAIMGTALSNFQCQFLKRHCETIYLFLDNDQAGKKATLNSIESLQQNELYTKVIELKEEKDAAQVLEKKNINKIKKNIEEAKSIYEFIFDEKYEKINSNDINQKSNLITAMIHHLEPEKDPIIKDHYIQKFSKKLEINPELIMVKIKKKSYNKPRKKVQNTPIINKHDKTEEYILYLMVTSKKYKKIIINHINFKNIKNKNITKMIESIKEKTTFNNDLIKEIEDPFSKDQLSQMLLNQNHSFLDQVNEDTVIHFITLINKKETKETLTLLRTKLEEYEKENNDSKAREIQIKINQLIKTQ